MKFAELIRDDKVKKSASLYLTMALSTLAGIIVSILNTHILGAKEYGDFRFILNAYQFIITFLTIGIFYSGSRLIAKQLDIKAQRVLFGDILILSFIISLFFSFTLLIFGLIEPIFFNKGLKSIILISIPLTLVFPLQLCLEQSLQGNNRIYSLSLLRITPKLLYIILIVSVYYLITADSLAALFCHLLSLLIAIIVIISIQKPIFNFKLVFLKEIIQETKTFGIHVYFGAITGVASHYLAGLILAKFSSNNIPVGHFMLALTATMPLSMLPASIGTTYFKDFVSIISIPKKIIFFTIVSGIVLLIGFNLTIGLIVNKLYPNDFFIIVEYCRMLSYAAILQGFGDFFNKFLSAKGYGKTLRNSNFTIGTTNVLFYFLLIPKYGIYGAIATRIISSSVYLIFLFTKYILIQLKNERELSNMQ